MFRNELFWDGYMCHKLKILTYFFTFLKPSATLFLECCRNHYSICINFIFLAVTSTTGTAGEVVTYAPSLRVQMHSPFSNYHSYNILDSLFRTYIVNTTLKELFQAS